MGQGFGVAKSPVPAGLHRSPGRKVAESGAWRCINAKKITFYDMKIVTRGLGR